MTVYHNEFSKITFNLIYAFDDSEEMLEIFNTLVRDCIERHASIKRVKITRPPCPWLKNGDIQALQHKHSKLHAQAHKTSLNSVWRAFRGVWSILNPKIKSEKKAFLQTALSSKNSKKVSTLIQDILNTSSQPLCHDQNELNSYFAYTVQRTLVYSDNICDSDLFAYIDSLLQATHNPSNLIK